MTTWFTSDLHLGHKNIIRLCNRPFADLKEMHEALLDNWNSVVKPTDTVYILGDLAYKSKEEYLQTFLESAHGSKWLVRGNHDKPDLMRRMECLGLLHILPDYTALQRPEGISKDVVLFHYPIECWNGKYRGSIHLHGHSHGKAREITGRADVGVDSWSYTPVSLEAAVVWAETDASLRMGKSML